MPFEKSEDLFWGGPMLTKKIQLQGYSDVFKDFAFVFMNTQIEPHSLRVNIFSSCRTRSLYFFSFWLKHFFKAE